ncbi:MAG TPA: DUF2334 domain-containing protein [Gaiellaceae bacterium]|nr:DUF2334 domain-containing protein [Gaiellaceae bacterium]
MSRRWWIPVAVLATIVGFVLLPAREQLTSTGAPDLQPLGLGTLSPPERIPIAETYPAEHSPHVRTLVLYDETGPWGWLGELYATLTANLVSHFGRWEARPASAYRAGDVSRYDALVYIGSTYGERLPRSLLDDVLSTDRPVLWINDNIHQLVRRAGTFAAHFGWQPSSFDRAPVAEVRYKGRSLSRWARQPSGIMRCELRSGSRARALATAVRPDGSTLPWAVRSRNLVYVAENPFAYTSETDRVLVFADLLFELLAPRTPERHRALVRLEDVNPRSDPDELRAAADYLHAKGIPFGFGVSPYYRDPQGREDPPYELELAEAPELVSALRYLERRGGVLVGHGYTHQWDGASNPYNGVTGDDVEFYRVTEDAEGDVQSLGPLPGDRGVAWSEHRIVAANRAFAAAGLRRPRIFEFPHYFASANAYLAAAHRFAVRWERSTYFAGLLRSGRVDHTRGEGQFFPYVVRDVYGSKVLPENLGSLSPNAWHSYKARSPQDLVRAARANLVVRDGFASFYFHPFLDLELLKRTVEGIEALGYTFVDPRAL